MKILSSEWEGDYIKVLPNYLNGKGNNHPIYLEIGHIEDEVPDAFVGLTEEEATVLIDEMIDILGKFKVNKEEEGKECK